MRDILHLTCTPDLVWRSTTARLPLAVDLCLVPFYVTCVLCFVYHNIAVSTTNKTGLHLARQNCFAHLVFPNTHFPSHTSHLLREPGIEGCGRMRRRRRAAATREGGRVMKIFCITTIIKMNLCSFVFYEEARFTACSKKYSIHLRLFWSLSILTLYIMH